MNICEMFDKVAVRENRHTVPEIYHYMHEERVRSWDLKDSRLIIQDF